MTEKTEFRICKICEVERRTTVRFEEEAVYICEQCFKKDEVREYLLRKHSSKVIGYAAIGFIAVGLLLAGKFWL